MKVDIDDDICDEITRLSLESSIRQLKLSVDELRRNRHRKPWEDQDLADGLLDLSGLDTAFQYYGGNYKHANS